MNILEKLNVLSEKNKNELNQKMRRIQSDYTVKEEKRNKIINIITSRQNQKSVHSNDNNVSRFDFWDNISVMNYHLIPCLSIMDILSLFRVSKRFYNLVANQKIKFMDGLHLFLTPQVIIHLLVPTTFSNYIWRSVTGVTIDYNEYGHENELLWEDLYEIGWDNFSNVLLHFTSLKTLYIEMCTDYDNIYDESIFDYPASLTHIWTDVWPNPFKNVDVITTVTRIDLIIKLNYIAPLDEETDSDDLSNVIEIIKETFPKIEFIHLNYSVTDEGDQYNQEDYAIETWVMPCLKHLCVEISWIFGGCNYFFGLLLSNIIEVMELKFVAVSVGLSENLRKILENALVKIVETTRPTHPIIKQIYPQLKSLTITTYPAECKFSSTFYKNVGKVFPNATFCYKCENIYIKN